MTSTIRFLAAGVAALLLTGCSGPSDGAAADATAGQGGLHVVTTVSPLTSIASAVGGDLVQVAGIVPEGTNSHTFEPPPSAAGLLSRADVIFVNGLQLEDPTVALAEANKKPDTHIVELGTTVLPESDYIYDFSFPKEDGKPNPHLWTDPVHAAAYAALIADTYIELDPAHAGEYQANLRDFVASTEALAAAIRADQTSVPGGVKLVTYHDAYAYVARRFGWDVVGAIQPADFAEPTAREVARLVEQIESEDVSAIFGSEVFPSPVLAEIAAETGARYIDDLRDDDLPGVPGDPEHSWLGLMRFDYVTMFEGLGGTATALRALDTTASAPDSAEYPQ